MIQSPWIEPPKSQLHKTRYALAACFAIALFSASICCAPAIWSLELLPGIESSPMSCQATQASSDVPVQIRVPVPVQLDKDAPLQVFAFTNQPPGIIDRIVFYAEEIQPEAAFPLRLVSLGSDDADEDGWQLSVDPALLSPLGECRIVAMAELEGGRIMWAQSEPFVSPVAELLVEPARDSSSPLSVPVLALPLNDSRAAALVVANQGGAPPAVSEFRESRLLGAMGDGLSPLWQRGFWSSADVSGALADGVYDLAIMGADETSNGLRSGSLHSLVVQEDVPPQVEVVLPAPLAAVSSPFKVAMKVDDVDSTIEWVDVYMYRDGTLCPGVSGEAPYSDDMIWLGTDTSDADGWNIEARVPDDWYGENWRIVAVASDSSGVAGWGESQEPFAILAEGQPRVLLATPLTGATITRDVRVQAVMTASAQSIEHMGLYLIDAEGRGVYIGSMSGSNRTWEFDWDTTTVEDGVYSLYIVTDLAGGCQVLSPPESIRVVNSAPRLIAVLPRVVSSGDALNLELRISSGSCSVATVRVSDDSGVVVASGELNISQNVARETINTEDWLDGSYELSVIARDDITGRATFVQETFEVARSLQATTLVVHDGELGGVVPLTWSLDDEIVSTSLTIQYSPDAGAHWLVVNSGELESPYSWDTREMPDSSDGRLRLLNVSDLGIFSVEQAVVVNNINDGPSVFVSSPSPEERVGAQCSVNWQAYDTDGDPLSARVEYRLVGGDWHTIANQDVSQGHVVWLTRYLTPGAYQVRVKVFDSEGAVGSDQVYPVNLTGNSAPVIRLNAPLANMALGDQAIVLWNTYDADDDDLTIAIEYSNDAGKTWLPLADDLPNTGYYLWQFSYLPPGERYRLRVIADDGQAIASDETAGLLTVGSSSESGYKFAWPREGSSLEGIVFLCWRAPRTVSQSSPVSLMYRDVANGEWLPVLEDCAHSCFGVWDAVGLEGEYKVVLGIFGRVSGHYELLQALDEINVTVGSTSTSPEVYLDAPRAGQVVGTEFSVSWSTRGVSSEATADIYVWTDSDPVWHLAETVAAADGQCLVGIGDDSLATVGMVRVSVVDGTAHVSDRMQGVFCLAGSNVHPPNLQVISPSPAGLLSGDRLMWLASDPDDDELTVSVDISRDAGFSWQQLAQGLAAGGVYDVSQLVLDSSTRFRISVSDGAVIVSWVSSVLDLASRPYIRIETPQFGERLSGLEQVRWTRSDAPEAAVVDVELSTDGLAWDSIGQGLLAEGSSMVDLSDLQSGWYWLRVVVAGDVPRAAVAGPFEVTTLARHAPLVSLDVATEGLPMSGLEQVSWRVIDQDNEAVSTALAYSLDQGISWTTFATGSQDRDQVLWDTRTLPNTDQLWLRVMASDGRYTSTDYLGPLLVANGDYPSIGFLSFSADIWTGVQRVSWSGAWADEASGATSVRLELSLDRGRTWNALATGKELDDSYVWDTQSTTDGSSVVFRILASQADRVVAIAHSEPLVVWGNGVLEQDPE